MAVDRLMENFLRRVTYTPGVGGMEAMEGRDGFAHPRAGVWPRTYNSAYVYQVALCTGDGKPNVGIGPGLGVQLHSGAAQRVCMYLKTWSLEPCCHGCEP
jgi:hypothetical protein